VELPDISWRPLGQLFVEKGLLDEDRLDYALAEQARSGGRLGEKLVELGYISSTALARLLAEQYGVELTLDTGFGTGLRAELERRLDESDSESEHSEPMTLTLVEAPPEPDNADDTPHTPLAALEDQLAKLAAAYAQVAELESVIEAMRESASERETHVAELVGQIRERDERIAVLSVPVEVPKKRASNGKARS
jgi:hypothetical protein